MNVEAFVDCAVAVVVDVVVHLYGAAVDVRVVVVAVGRPRDIVVIGVDQVPAAAIVVDAVVDDFRGTRVDVRIVIVAVVPGVEERVAVLVLRRLVALDGDIAVRRDCHVDGTWRVTDLARDSNHRSVVAGES